MKRTNTDGHIANKYTDGIPGSVAATIVGAEEMNNIQEEIALTVEASGQTVDQTGATDDQLIDAIKILAERNRTVSGDDVVGTRTGLSPLDKVSFLPTVRSFLENKILTASDAANTDWFGLTISIYGDTIVVGAGLEDGAGSDRGAAYVFRGAANEFLLPPSPTIGDKIEVWDGNGDFGEYTLDIDPNGKKIRGSTDTLSFITQNEVVDLVYVSEDQGWNYRKETKDNPIITKINPFTMDVQTSTTAPTLHATAVERSSWYRVGNMMHISFKLVQDLGSGTAGTGTYRFMIPNSKTIDQDYAIISTVNTMNFGCSVGHASAYDDNLGYFSHGFVYVAGTNYLHMYLKRSATGFSDVSSTTFDFGVENYMSFNAVVPIAEWA